MTRALERVAATLTAPTVAVVHGDANATNFLFAESGPVAIDLERVGLYDPALDVGFLAAEIMHLVLQYGGDVARAWPLVGVLLGSYRSTAHTRSLPGMYVAMGLWRVARNRWVPRAHRTKLFELSRLVLAGETTRGLF